MFTSASQDVSENQCPNSEESVFLSLSSEDSFRSLETDKQLSEAVDELQPPQNSEALRVCDLPTACPDAWKTTRKLWKNRLSRKEEAQYLRALLSFQSRMRASGFPCPKTENIRDKPLNKKPSIEIIFPARQLTDHKNSDTDQTKISKYMEGPKVRSLSVRHGFYNKRIEKNTPPAATMVNTQTPEDITVNKIPADGKGASFSKSFDKKLKQTLTTEKLQDSKPLSKEPPWRLEVKEYESQSHVCNKGFMPFKKSISNFIQDTVRDCNITSPAMPPPQKPNPNLENQSRSPPQKLSPKSLPKKRIICKTKRITQPNPQVGPKKPTKVETIGTAAPKSAIAKKRGNTPTRMKQSPITEQRSKKNTSSLLRNEYANSRKVQEHMKMYARDTDFEIRFEYPNKSDIWTPDYVLGVKSKRK